MAARGFYQNTVALAQPDGTLKALSGVNVFVYQPGTTTLVTIYAGRTGGAAATNPVLTDPTGAVEFYADVGEYDIRFKDTNAVPRIADRTVGWSAFNGSNQGLPTALIQRDGGLDLTAIAADVMRQMLPIGSVIDWWRPDSTVPLPSGFEICDGHVVNAGSHDFSGWTSNNVTLPDLRNKFVMGADVLKSDGSASNNGDGTSAFNVAHPNAPGIRGVGGSNTVKNLQHTHQFGHTHGIPGVDHLHSVPGVDHLHGSAYTTGGHAHSVPESGSTVGPFVSGGGTLASNIHHTHTTDPVGNLGVGGTSGAADRSLSTTSGVADRSLATTTNTQSTTTTDNGTMSSATDMRPQHVGLLKLMKVRRA